MKPPGIFRAAAVMLAKDLRIELRTRESVPAMALFSVTVFVLFHFGTGRDTLEGDLAAGVLWVTLLLATVLGVNRLFAAEREQGGIDAILLTPVDRTAVFVAKAAALFLYLVVLELVAVPAFLLLLLEPGTTPAIGSLALVLLAANVGLAAVGALVSALAAETRARDLVVPLLLLPLVVPLAIAGAGASEPLLGGATSASGLGLELGLIGLYDMVFLLLSVAVFDFLLED
jgi:heme exporter protein B